MTEIMTCVYLRVSGKHKKKNDNPMLTSITRKILAFVFILTAFHLDSFGQNCFCISGTKDKEKGTETIGGVTNSKDFYSLLIQKVIHQSDTTVKPTYIFYLNAASRVLLSDSMLKTTGVMKLQLLDNSTVTYDSVSYYNNPLGFCCSLGFKVYLTEEQVIAIAKNPIVSITVLNSLTTSFNSRRQKEQQKIINCLILRH